MSRPTSVTYCLQQAESWGDSDSREWHRWGELTRRQLGRFDVKGIDVQGIVEWEVPEGINSEYYGVPEDNYTEPCDLMSTREYTKAGFL